MGVLTLGGMLTEQCARFADNEALVFDDPLLDGATTRWTYTDLYRHARRVGKALFTRHPSVHGDEGWTMPIGYGLSETSSFFTGFPCDTPREVVRNGSLGRLLPGNELRVVDPESGRVLGPGEDGELIVRGPTLMEHYVGRTRAECFDRDGFFHTGDLGSYDEHGNVSFCGRRSEMIKTAGANVSPVLKMQTTSVVLATGRSIRVVKTVSG